MMLPQYSIIFAFLFRFRRLIKAMTEMFADLMVDGEVNKREFLLEKIQNGEKISNVKTPWTAERLEKASDKVVDKLYEKYRNPRPVSGSARSKVNTQEALEMGKPVCPVVIEIGSKMIEQMGENSATRAGVSLAAMTWSQITCSGKG